MRVFISIEIPDYIKSKIFKEFENLRKKSFVRGNFISKKDLHITLKFLGELSEEEIENIKKKLGEIVVEEFECELKGGGFFDKNVIKVLWAEVNSLKLENLVKVISQKFLRFKKNFKKFNSYITTVRVKQVKNKSALIEFLDRLNFKGISFPVKEFVLMKSELTREGIKYKILERFSLKEKKN